MEIIVLKNKANKLTFELEGVGHTFCNALKNELREDSNVSIATYNISHPLQAKPKFFLETSKGKPVDALQKAIKGLKKKNSEFVKEFNSMK